MSIPALFAPLQLIVDVLEPVLVFFHDDVGLGWGMAIVALTVCVRALLLPLTVKQFRSMQAFAKVAPELKALQAKYKDDKQRQQQEVMKFYRERQVNPFASCLPLLAQLPFFLGLFYLLQGPLRREICNQTKEVCGKVATSNGAEEFLFIPDLTDKASGGVLVVLVVLYIGSQLLSGVLMSVSADPMQRRLIIALPFVFTVFIINFPAGLIVYWITTNLWTVGQQYVIRRMIGPLQPVAVPAGGGAPEPVRGGWLAALTGASGNGKADEEKATAAVGEPAARRGSGGARAAGDGKKAGGGAPAGGKGARGAEGKGGGGADGKGKTGKTTQSSRPSGPPPRSPRKKKKRSGRRR